MLKRHHHIFSVLSPGLFLLQPFQCLPSMLFLRIIAVFSQINGIILLLSSSGGYSWSFLLSREGLTAFPSCAGAVLCGQQKERERLLCVGCQDSSNMIYNVIKPREFFFRFLKAAFQSYICHI